MNRTYLLYCNKNGRVLHELKPKGMMFFGSHYDFVRHYARFCEVTLNGKFCAVVELDEEGSLVKGELIERRFGIEDVFIVKRYVQGKYPIVPLNARNGLYVSTSAKYNNACNGGNRFVGIIKCLDVYAMQRMLDAIWEKQEDER